MMNLREPLLSADRPVWRAAWYHQYPNYDAIARMLNTAFLYLGQSEAPPHGEVQAWRDLRHWLLSKLPPAQRMCILNLLARAEEAEGNYPEAIPYVDQALEVATDPVLAPQFTALWIYRAKLERGRLCYSVAVSNIETSLAHLDNRPMSYGLLPDRDRLDSLILLAEYSYFPRDLRRSKRAMRDALALAQQVSQPLDRATLFWMALRLNRLGNSTNFTTDELQGASLIYDTDAPLASRACFHAFVAESQMDSLDPIGDATVVPWLSTIEEAATRAQHAFDLAVQSKSDSCRCLAQLALIRCSRLLGQDDDRVAQIERIIARARWLDDHALLAQAFVALGDEFASRRNRFAAIDCYRQSIHMLDGSEVEVLSFPAQQRLLSHSAVYRRDRLN